MFEKDGVVYSDGYKYLKHKTESVVGFAVPGKAEDFEEADVDMSTLKVDSDTVTLNGMLKIGIGEWSHKAIKLKIIASRYSNDDQIGIGEWSHKAIKLKIIASRYSNDDHAER